MAIDNEKEKAIRAAVAPVLEKIRVDRERVDAELQGFLDYLADNLLYEKATAAEGFRLSGITSKSKPEDFKIAIGVTPGVYIKDFQMEIVGRLLRSECEFTLEEIAEVVGYFHGGSLSRAFTSWARMTPAAFRERTLALRAAGVEPPDLKFFRTGWALGVEFERADRAELEELMHGLIGFKNLEGSSLPTENPLLVTEEIVLAEEFGRWLIESVVEEREQGIRWAGVFQTPALFEYLLEQSRVVGRGDRKKGVWVAELALESLKGLTWRLGAEEMVYQRIRGWSYLGLARRLSGDSSGAEEAFSEALSLSRLSEAPSLVLAELSSFFASFRAFQRRWAEALRFAEDALSNMSPQGDEKLRAETMIVVGGVHGFEGNWPCALSNFQGARERAQSLDDSYLHLSVESHLVWANFKTGHLSEAEASLKRAFDLAKKIGLESAYPHLFWLKGIGAAEKKDLRRAEEALRRAFTGFQNLGDFPCSAAVGLELAIILSWQGKQREVLEVARAALPVLQELQLNEECLVLVAVLEQAIVEQKLETALLFRLRSRIGAELGMLELLREQGGHRVAPQEPCSSRGDQLWAERQ